MMRNLESEYNSLKETCAGAPIIPTSVVDSIRLVFAYTIPSSCGVMMMYLLVYVCSMWWSNSVF